MEGRKGTRLIADNVVHLTRGQVFTIEGMTFFTFGGATSTDKEFRTEGKSWWAAERPTEEDVAEADRNLDRVGRTVDYILMHSCDEKTLYSPAFKRMNLTSYPENFMLSHFEETVKYKHWYFGHYHLDAEINDKKTVLYQKIVRIGGES